jgi:hypothetical protein
MRTYLTLWFNSNGESPSKIVEKITGLGFKAMAGNYDLEYIWESNPSTDDILRLGNLVQEKLGGTKTLFSMDTL